MGNITFTWKQGEYRDNDKNIVSKYFIQSGNYRVSTQGPDDDQIYTSWVRGKPWKSIKVCQGKDGVDKAKAACELHYMRTLK